MSVSAVLSVVPSFSLDLEQILLNFPEENREEESLQVVLFNINMNLKYLIYNLFTFGFCMQVNFCVLRNISLLRRIYAFYSKLCKDNFRGSTSVTAGEDNTFVMDRLQFWRFLKDIHINEHEITVIEIDRLLGERTLLFVTQEKCYFMRKMNPVIMWFERLHEQFKHRLHFLWIINFPLLS